MPPLGLFNRAGAAESNITIVLAGVFGAMQIQVFLTDGTRRAKASTGKRRALAYLLPSATRCGFGHSLTCCPVTRCCIKSGIAHRLVASLISIHHWDTTSDVG
jgi:hypothetical protein